jgi:hypothetical protein
MAEYSDRDAFTVRHRMRDLAPARGIRSLAGLLQERFHLFPPLGGDDLGQMAATPAACALVGEILGLGGDFQDATLGIEHRARCPPRAPSRREAVRASTSPGEGGRSWLVTWRVGVNVSV